MCIHMLVSSQGQVNLLKVHVLYAGILGCPKKTKVLKVSAPSAILGSHH